MHSYLATICRDVGADFVRVGGVADHVHIVTTLPRILSQAQLIERIKKVSSKWIKALDVRYRGFFWQRGYGAFSVSPSQLDSVLEYGTITLAHFRKNIGSCCAGTALISTNGMCGIEVELRFQRLFIDQVPGAMPQADSELAPLALRNVPLKRGVPGRPFRTQSQN